MDFGLLPKDLRIEICKKLDIDARIRLGMVRKFKTPTWLQDKLAAVFQHTKKTIGTANVMYFVDLGLYWVAFDMFKGRKTWMVFELISATMHMYSEETNTWGML